jgi:hypothetical protein
MAEQRTLNPQVLGSNPRGRTRRGDCPRPSLAVSVIRGVSQKASAGTRTLGYGHEVAAHLLTIGDRVLVEGGCEMDPAWLGASGSRHLGTVVAFIPGQNDQPAAVIALDEELVLPNGAGAVQDNSVRGRYLVLELSDRTSRATGE